MKELLVGAILITTTAIVIKRIAKKKSVINLTLGDKDYQPFVKQIRHEDIKVNNAFIEDLITKDVILPDHLDISGAFIEKFNDRCCNH